MATALTPQQELATKAFLETVNVSRGRRRIGPVSWSTAVKFLLARKFDVTRAVALYEQHEITRLREGLINFDPTADPLCDELKTGKFTILSSRDASGAAIALFTANLHIPQKCSHQTTLQGVVYQLDAALSSPQTQRSGLVFIYDMSDSKYSNFDYDLSQKILTLLKGAYPAKLKKVLIVTAPLWFKAPFRILRLFVREKLRERVYTVSIPQLTQHIPRSSLPPHLGGDLAVDHSAWLKQCHAEVDEEYISAPSTDTAASQLEVMPSVLMNPQIPQHNENLSPQKNNIIGHDRGDINVDIWGEEAGINPPSSASSGFSDDDSLHGDGAAMTIEQIIDYVRERGRIGLVQDYAEIRARPPDGSFNIARLRNNLPKNRYTDVLCFDHSRVLLSQIDGDSCSDYINANFVDGYKQKNAYISTQGPLPKTAGDFWRMVWEQHTLVVVMTTRVTERGRVKCHQYWETDIGGLMTHGFFNVRTTAIETLPDYTISTIELTNLKTDEVRTISHLQFTSWPDYGVPRSALAMLDFLAKVRQEQAAAVAALSDTWAGHPRGPPIVVHCSAGIGRTGTFCTLDICISRLEDIGTADVRGTVEKIRSQRAYSIQMPDQYVFCHLALIEYALSKELVSSADLTGFDNSPEDDSD
ncbi:tyrosine-protein phosphatase non-receptor type 9 [Chrysoperla carnea]|uniref:tyrosine-protein phosphatase non-receptor type 9 n=1 Tax=Chrysoperla carnea TaxID=189513 RepID=UPI001D094BA9|nr:tyrosine-protein phosphatase non-receptor type 9 [Chrysoperla carnea]